MFTTFVVFGSIVLLIELRSGHRRTPAAETQQATETPAAETQQATETPAAETQQATQPNKNLAEKIPPNYNSCIIQQYRCSMNNLPAEEVNLLRRNARSMIRELGLLNDAYFDIGVTLAERHLLIELSICLYPTVGDIAERLLLDKSTASRLIAKAVKKGYVIYATDDNDKRKRFLQFTDTGGEVLHSFEPIAFNQTKDALLTLSEDEIKTVYRGIELYAKGLKHSRLRSKIVIAKITQQDNAGLAHLLAETHNQEPLSAHNIESEWSNLYDTYQKKGSSYLVIKMGSKIVGGAGIAPYQLEKTSRACQLEKICLLSELRDLGFEKILMGDCLLEAKRLGYQQCYVDAEMKALFPKSSLSKQNLQSVKIISKPVNRAERLLNVNKQLNEMGFTLKPYKPKDENQLYAIFQHVVESGGQFPFECSSKEEFHRQFLNEASNVYVCHSPSKEVVGGFYIKPNFSDRSSHIANAAYMLREKYQGQGIGTLLLRASLYMAKELGFDAMQFNRVFSQNIAANRLYQKLGFKIIGTIPDAILNPDGTYQDAYIMYQSLEDY